VSASGRPKSLSDEDKLVLDARPAAIKVARIFARLWRVRSPALLEDCEQAACQAQLEARPGYKKALGSFEVYQWKRVAGAVTNLLRRERAGGRTGFDDALDETDDFKDATEPDFYAADSDDMNTLKAYSRLLTFRRVMGDTRVALQARPDNDALRTQIFGALRHALGGLTDRQMRVIDLHYWQDLTWKEVGDQMGISDRHAKRIDREIRDLLEGDLRQHGVDAPPPSVNL
jgi:RNA polymerase sigma factor for flagellar operon FliA